MPQVVKALLALPEVVLEVVGQRQRVIPELQDLLVHQAHQALLVVVHQVQPGLPERLDRRVPLDHKVPLEHPEDRVVLELLVQQDQLDLQVVGPLAVLPLGRPDHRVLQVLLVLRDQVVSWVLQEQQEQQVFLGPQDQ